MVAETLHVADHENGGEVHYFNLSTIMAATNNFSDENKLGEGGFGSVYWGKTTDGLQVFWFLFRIELTRI